MRNGRFRVGKHKATGGNEKPVVGTFEDKLRSHHEVVASVVNSRHTRGAEAAGKIVFSVKSASVVDVLEQMAQCIGTHRAHGAKTLVDIPHEVARRDRIWVD